MEVITFCAVAELGTIDHKILIKADPSSIYDALTTKEGIQNWWTPDVVIEPKVGSIAEFIFKDRYHNKMEIIDLLENHRVEWKCLEGDDEWVGTHIIFELSEEDGKPLLTFKHTNWKAHTEFMDYCDEQMVSLRDYVEIDQGKPFSPLK